MDAVGIAATLAVVAAHLANKVIAFKRRIKGRQAILDGLIKSCEDVRLIARVITAEMKIEYGLANPKANREEDPWHLLAITLEALESLLYDFDRELGELTQETATTNLGRAILQIKTDDSVPRIRQIQEQIHEKYHILSITIPIALR